MPCSAKFSVTLQTEILFNRTSEFLKQIIFLKSFNSFKSCFTLLELAGIHGCVSINHEYMGTPPCFSVIGTKGNKLRDFLFAFLGNKALQKWVYSYRKEFAPKRANSFH